PDLGVARRVGLGDAGVAGTGEQEAVPHDDRADRHLAPRPGRPRLAQGLLHPPAVLGGGDIAPGGGARPPPGVESVRYLFSSFMPQPRCADAPVWDARGKTAGSPYSNASSAREVTERERRSV